MGKMILLVGEGLDKGVAGPEVQNENKGPLAMIKNLKKFF